MAKDKNRITTNEEMENAGKKRTPLKTTLKILVGILVLSAIPVVLCNPDVSLGPLDVLRQEFFKTELVLTGEKFSADGFVHAIQATDMRRIKLYVRSGANVDSMGKSGISPLCAAAQTGNKDMFLLKIFQMDSPQHFVPLKETTLMFSTCFLIRE